MKKKSKKNGAPITGHLEPAVFVRVDQLSKKDQKFLAAVSKERKYKSNYKASELFY